MERELWTVNSDPRGFSGQIVSQLNAVLFESMCCKAGKHLQAEFGLTRQKRNVRGMYSQSVKHRQAGSGQRGVGGDRIPETFRYFTGNRISRKIRQCQNFPQQCALPTSAASGDDQMTFFCQNRIDINFQKVHFRLSLHCCFCCI